MFKFLSNFKALSALSEDDLNPDLLPLTWMLYARQAADVLLNRNIVGCPYLLYTTRNDELMASRFSRKTENV